MEPEHTPDEQPASKFEKLHTVTPLSKYLAMVLFIALPFMGGYIDYSYAPEKVVEVEKRSAFDAPATKRKTANL